MDTLVWLFALGKGTLSNKLVQKYDVEPISTGDLLRAHVRARTEIGLRAENIMASGGILDDEIVLEVVSNKLNELKERGVQVRGLISPHPPNPPCLPHVSSACTRCGVASFLPMAYSHTTSTPTLPLRFFLAVTSLLMEVSSPSFRC